MSGTLPLRILLLLSLAAALVRTDEPPSAEAAPLLLRAWGDARGGGAERSGAAAALAGTFEPSVVVRRDMGHPTAAELEMLAALAAEGPLLVARPAASASLRVDPPAPARTERAAAVAFGLAVPPGDSVIVRLSDGAGLVDSVVVTGSPAGRGEAAFRVRPARAGWQEWRVEAGGVTRSTGAWVRATAPPRVLVVSGPPTWESRFTLRALDESGAATEAVIPLGRGLQAGGAGETMPSDSAALARYDAVVILPGAAVNAAALRALQRYTAGGGGVLAVGRTDVWQAFGLSSRAGEPRDVDAGAVRWHLPAELALLPVAELQTPARPLGGAGPGAWVGAVADGEPLLVLGAYGRGRVAGLGVLESWRWRMEGGFVDEHREFWRGLADWLGGDGGGAGRLHLAATTGAVGTPVHISGSGAGGQAPEGIRIERPDGRIERITPLPTGEEGEWRATFAPEREGVYRLAIADDAPAAAFHAREEAEPAPDAAARLALLAWASGGAVVPADSVGAWLEQRQAALGVPPGSGWLRWLLLATLLGLAISEWTTRRLRGQP
jgi:hypothetical protein